MVKSPRKNILGRKNTWKGLGEKVFGTVTAWQGSPGKVLGTTGLGQFRSYRPKYGSILLLPDRSQGNLLTWSCMGGTLDK